MAMVRSIFAAQGMEPALDHLLDNRARDLTNDGVPDSGADQWISDPFHTRDMVRQSTLDWTQFIRALKNCGQGSMNKVAVGGAVEGQATSCDWDGDGADDPASIAALVGPLRSGTRDFAIGSRVRGERAPDAAHLSPDALDHRAAATQMGDLGAERSLDRLRGLAELRPPIARRAPVEHHRAGQDHRRRVGDVLASDVGRATVLCLCAAMRVALICGAGEPKTARKLARKIRQDVSK